MGFFDKLKAGLTKTRDQLIGGIEEVFSFHSEIDDDFYEELEEALILADMGVQTSTEITERLRDEVKARKLKYTNEVKSLVKEIITDMIDYDTTDLTKDDEMNIILVIGVNGVGKTTTIGKISNQLKENGKKVLLAAADTFRAAAIDQLKVWADRAAVDIIYHNENADPGAVVYDAVQAAKSRKVDVLICDTAGRLHNKKNLMNELAKLNKIINRELPDANKEVLLVLDSTTGQNALQQAKLFKEAADITGIILTKLDGTAKGGIIVAIQQELGIPVKYIGVGEGIDDLQPFNPKEFIDALFEWKEEEEV
ncbi:signal recognition particle-docking protein FtsY [Vallitalea okinawensis]|uniref:signal recognition particle-docking protein FtsY n=1 Tax=Vallitalea okinawensis TaxID=2078660 RepID=UPI000CFBAE4B|nr:signal recognition particle-docking protein FtsY [Vallitalea okinawensis]